MHPTSASRLRATGLATVFALSLAACQTAPIDAQPAVKTIVVNGYRMPYVEQGRGETIVLVHGAVSDHRTWDRQRAALANRFRVIAYTQRYFGTGAWDAGWPKFSEQLHADDLAGLIRALGGEPAHLVGWSYSGQVVLAAALQHPELVKSAFVFEPGEPSYVTRPEDVKAIGDDAALAFGPTTRAMQRGDHAMAVRQLIDGVGERAGYFDAQAPALRSIQLDSARSMPVFWGHDNRPAITCEQLGQIKPKVAIVRGAAGRPYFRVIADTAMRCIPAGAHQIVPNAKHLWPGEDPAGFSEAVAAFVAGHR